MSQRKRQQAHDPACVFCCECSECSSRDGLPWSAAATAEAMMWADAVYRIWWGDAKRLPRTLRP